MMIQTFYYSPLLSVLFIAVFLFVMWYLIKDLFLLLYVGRGGVLPNGSENHSRDQILEMQSYCHSSPRCSYVASMSEGAMHRIVI